MINFEDTKVRKAKKKDHDAFLKTFAVWHKTSKQFNNYLDKQGNSESIFVIALTYEQRVVGYANLFWQSRIKWHRNAGVPEIVDLNVITAYQQKGIATKMIHFLEKQAIDHRITAIGIAVEPTIGYFPAKNLYHKLGFKDEKRKTVINGAGVLVMKKQLEKLKNE